MAKFSVVSQTLSPSASMCKIMGSPDAGGFEMLEEEFGKVLRSETKALVVEASGLENLTSAALGAIIDMKRLMEERGGRLILALLRPGNEGLLELLELENILPVAGSLEEVKKLIAAAR